MNDNICGFVRPIRKALGLTQDELTVLFNLADPTYLKISRGLLSKYESGDVDPPSTKYLKLKSVLEQARTDKIKALTTV